MKKVFLKLLLFVAVLAPLGINAAEKEKVNVYVFEAGDCGFCKQQVDYLKSLDSYNKKFKVVEKELYVSVDGWAHGKDYDLGQKVADAFVEVGFTDADYHATPFVVVSDLYAAAALNTSLEEVINQAYEEGDKDIVSCLKDGKEDCLAHLAKDTETVTNGTTSSVDYTLTIVLCSVAFIAAYLAKTTVDTNRIVEAIKTKNNSKSK